eukprot:UN24539
MSLKDLPYFLEKQHLHGWWPKLSHSVYKDMIRIYSTSHQFLGENVQIDVFNMEDIYKIML